MPDTESVKAWLVGSCSDWPAVIAAIVSIGRPLGG
jgi:hypothetical protein